MTVKDLAQKLELEVLTEGELERSVGGGFSGDLLSLAMSNVRKGDAWITVQTNVNVIAVAALTEAACVIVAEGMSVAPHVLTKAENEGISLLRSGKSAYALAGILHEALL